MSVSENRKRFIKLGWKIIEAKILYYDPPAELEQYANDNMLTDYEYDQMEVEYLRLCKELGEQNTVVHKEYSGLEVDGDGMMEVDWTRPSVNCALNKLYNKANIPEKDRRYF